MPDDIIKKDLAVMEIKLYLATYPSTRIRDFLHRELDFLLDCNMSESPAMIFRIGPVMASVGYEEKKA